MLRSDEWISSALLRASALVRSRGLGARVVERILLSSPQVCAGTLRIVSEGVCGAKGKSWSNVTEAVNGADLPRCGVPG